MRRTLVCVSPILSVVCLFLSSCGGNSNQPPFTAAGGNYSLKLQSGQTSQTLDWGGFLSTSGSSFSLVVLDPQYAACTHALVGPAAIPVTGTTHGGSVTLTSAAFDGGNVLKIALSGTTSPFTGTYAFAGGCNTDHGTLTATFVPPISGTWTSNITISGQPVTVTANLTQAPGPNAGGVIPLTGSFTLGGTSCYSGGTFDSSESYLWGDTVSMGTVATGVGVSFYVSGTLTSPASPTVINGTYWFPKTTCSGATGNIQFNKQ
jgi:hypothetical protein